MEDNIFLPLSPNASNGYINSIKINQQKISWFWYCRKIENNKSMLLFLDTKPGGFNLSDYGDEAISTPSVRGFNYFNNNPSTFDSYFQADYCLVIAKED
jgi:hypothetical protein